MKKTLIGLASVLLLLVALAGCNKTPTSEALLGQVAEKVGTAGSYVTASHLVMDAAISGGGMDMDMKMELDLDTSVIFSPASVQIKGNMLFDMFGESDSETLDLLEVTDGNDYLSYVKYDDYGWEKDKLTIPNRSNPFAGISAHHSGLTVAKETETVNGKECYVLSGELSGSALDYFLDLAMSVPGEDLFPLDKEGLKGTACPVTIYVEKIDKKEVGVPVQVKIDVSKYEGAPFGEDMGGATVTYNDYSLLMSFSSFNAVEPIHVPEAIQLGATLTGNALNVFADGEADWAKASFAIQGQKLALPLNYSDLLKMGFVLDEAYNSYDPIETLSPDDYNTYLYINAPGDPFTIPFVIALETPGDSECAVEDGIVTSVELFNTEYEIYGDLAIPGNVRIGSDKADAYAILGEPVFELDDFAQWDIYWDEGSIRYTMDFDDYNTIKSIRLSYYDI